MRLLLVKRRSARSDDERTLVFVALDRLGERMKGLLGTTSEARPVALVPCASVHTFGMRYRIDVAFVSKEGVVLDVWRSVPSCRLLCHGRAWITLERPHRRGPWLRVGEELSLRLVESGDVRGTAYGARPLRIAGEVNACAMRATGKEIQDAG